MISSSNEAGYASDRSCATDNHDSVLYLGKKRGGTPEKGRGTPEKGHNSFYYKKSYSGCDLKKIFLLRMKLVMLLIARVRQITTMRLLIARVQQRTVHITYLQQNTAVVMITRVRQNKVLWWLQPTKKGRKKIIFLLFINEKSTVMMMEYLILPVRLILTLIHYSEVFITQNSKKSSYP